MSPKPNVSAERVPQILDAATVVLSRMGLAHARMEDIAEEAGLSKGTLYLYFKSRDAIIEGIMDSFLSRELDVGQELLTTNQNTIDKLIHFFSTLSQDTQKLQPLIPLYFELLALAPRMQRVQDTIQHFYTEFLNLLDAIIQQGIDSGEIPKINTREVAITFTALFEGTILLWIIAPDVVNLEKQVLSSVQIQYNGLRHQGG
jgi:AcrR family transcriptional regulator